MRYDIYNNILLIQNILFNSHLILKMLRKRNYVQGYFTIFNNESYSHSMGTRVKFTGLTFMIVGFGLASKNN